MYVFFFVGVCHFMFSSIGTSMSVGSVNKNGTGQGREDQDSLRHTFRRPY
jgi:hypothetical protein